MSLLKNLGDIKHALYINLDRRKDRRQHMESELTKLNLNCKVERFSAVAMPSLGAIGCSLSHLKCLQTARRNEWPHVLIMEDDVIFVSPEQLKQQFSKFFASVKQSWDVLLLAGNCCPPYVPHSNGVSVQVRRCLTTAAYLVNGHYYDTLIKNISEGVSQLMEHKEQKTRFAIDVYWMQLQDRDRWFLLTPIQVTQRPDYSDIERCNTDFSQHLLKLH